MRQMPFPCCPLQDAGIGEHGPEVRDELPTFGQVHDVCLRVVGWRDVQNHLCPELSWTRPTNSSLVELMSFIFSAPTINAPQLLLNDDIITFKSFRSNDGGGVEWGRVLTFTAQKPLPLLQWPMTRWPRREQKGKEEPGRDVVTTTFPPSFSHRSCSKPHRRRCPPPAIALNPRPPWLSPPPRLACIPCLYCARPQR